MRVAYPPFWFIATYLSRSWFDKALLSEAEECNTNGLTIKLSRLKLVAEIFEYELMIWNDLKHEWPEDWRIDVFLDRFELTDVYDLASEEIETWIV